MQINNTLQKVDRLGSLANTKCAMEPEIYQAQPDLVCGCGVLLQITQHVSIWEEGRNYDGDETIIAPEAKWLADSWMIQELGELDILG